MTKSGRDRSHQSFRLSSRCLQQLFRYYLIDHPPPKVRHMFLQQTHTVRLCSRRHEYEYNYKSGFPFMAHRSFTRTSGTFMVTCTKHITRRMSAKLNEIESRKYSAIKTTIFHHIAKNFTTRAPLTMNNFTMTSVLTSNMRRSFYK